MLIGKAVDKMAADVEEFGTVSISAPLLTLPTKRLWFNLRNTADNYYQNARTEVAGRALAATAIAQSLGVGAKAAVDIDQLNIARAITSQIAPGMAANRELEDIKRRRANLAFDLKKSQLPDNATDADKLQNQLDAETARATVLKEASGAQTVARPATTADNKFEPTSAAGQTGTEVKVVEDKSKPIKDADGKDIPGMFATTTTTTTTSNSTPSDVAPHVEAALIAAAALDASHTATGPAGKAFFGSEIKLPDIDAVKAAESATSLQGLENFFHYPQEAMQFRDKVVMMGAVTVGVAPGWRTSKEFAAEVVMSNKYRWVEARRTTVARMVADPRLSLPLREQLARDYHIPWNLPAAAARREVADLTEKFLRTKAESDTAQALLPQLKQLRETAQSLLDVALHQDADKARKIIEDLNNNKRPVPPKPPAGESEEDQARRAEAMDRIRIAEARDIAKEDARRRQLQEDIQKADTGENEARRLLAAYEAAGKALSAAQRSVAAAGTNFNTSNLPDVGGSGPLAEQGAGSPWPTATADRDGRDPKFLHRRNEPMLVGREDIPSDLLKTFAGPLYNSPLVSGISPLSQADTLDLASEYKRQDQFALALSLALRKQGAQGDAKIFEQFVKNQQKDVQTRSVSSTVATYARGGGIVGFQIGPRLKALADPASRKNVSGFVLERQAFPALLVYGLDAQDIYPKIEYTDCGLKVWEPKIYNIQYTYWRPLTYRFQGPKDWFNPFKCIWPPIWWESAQKQTQLVDRSLRLHDALWDAYENLGSHAPESGTRQGGIWDEAKALNDRGMEMKERYIGTQNDQWLPAEVLVPSGPLPFPDSPVVVTPPEIFDVKPLATDVAGAKKDPAKPDLTPKGDALVNIVISGQALDNVTEVVAFPDTVIKVVAKGSDGLLKTEVTSTAVTIKAKYLSDGTVTLRLRMRSDAYGPPPATGPEFKFTQPIKFKLIDGGTEQASASSSAAVESLARASGPAAITNDAEPLPPPAGWPRAIAVKAKAEPLLYPDEMPSLLTGKR